MNIHAIQTPEPEKSGKVRVSWNPNLTDEEALALNKQLMEACLACDFAGVEALLEQGADPLGSCTADGHGNDELVLESLFMEAIHFGDSEDADRMGKRSRNLSGSFLRTAWISQQGRPPWTKTMKIISARFGIWRSVRMKPG